MAHSNSKLRKRDRKVLSVKKQNYFDLWINFWIRKENDKNINSEDEDTEIETPTLAQAIEACNVLLKFVENSPVISEPNKIQGKRQSNIKEYF